jgi:polyketide cyclase/dehydrase/lipid transport protein
MASFENTVMIRRPIEEVFAFLSDFENVPKWNYAILETHKVSEGPVGVGTIYQQVRSVPSRSEERFEVTAYNPPRELEIGGQLGPFPARLSYGLRRSRGNPGHEPGGAGTPWPGPPARASRRATCPGRRGRQPQQAQGTAGPIGCGAHWGHRPTASTGHQRTVPASKRPGRRLLTTLRRRSRDRPCRSLKATVRGSSPWRRTPTNPGQAR